MARTAKQRRRSKHKFRSNTLKRSHPSQEPYARILIVCVGEVTEPVYFNAFCADMGANVEIQVLGLGYTPHRLLSEATSRRNDAARRARGRNGDPYERFDETWCVFDVDGNWIEWDIANVISSAKANDIRLAISNPCFELWALMHYERSDGEKTQDEVINRLAKILPGYKKVKSCVLPYTALKDRYQFAADNAQALCAARAQDADEYGNPSTTVQDLTESIIDRSRRPTGNH